MLKAAAYAAECFLAYAEVRSDMAQRYPLKNMRCVVKQVFITLCRCFKLGIDKPFFQPI